MGRLLSISKEEFFKKKKGYFFLKRLFDLTASFFGLLLLIPFFLIIMVIIRLDSKGFPVFVQKRAGKDGKIFMIFKFRTMKLKAPIIDQPVSLYDDQRVTKVGRLLRKTKIDELPQLINVFLGQMSIVGPRPLVPEHINLYTEDQQKVLWIKPGITDLASISFRMEEEMLLKSDYPLQTYIHDIIPKKVELNFQYMSKMSLFYDIFIIIKTIFSINKL